MTLDVRRPLGWLFLTLGLILLGYGWLAPLARQVHPQPNHSLNLLWGAIFALFGVGILILSRPGRSGGDPSGD